jgi:hypothetical protein
MSDDPEVVPLLLLRPRFLRRPPVHIGLGDYFTVAVTLTDDLGSPFVNYSALPRTRAYSLGSQFISAFGLRTELAMVIHTVRIEVLDARSDGVLDGLVARVSNSSSADFTIDPSHGDVHPVTLSLVRTSGESPPPPDVKHVRLRLSALPAPMEPNTAASKFSKEPKLSRSELDMLGFVDADISAVRVSLDETVQFVTLPTCTAPIELSKKKLVSTTAKGIYHSTG